MSQKKVDKYKQDKANRQKIMKREKVLRRVEITVAAVVLAALLVWFCIAVYRNLDAAGFPIDVVPQGHVGVLWSYGYTSVPCIPPVIRSRDPALSLLTALAL